MKTVFILFILISQYGYKGVGATSEVLEPFPTYRSCNDMGLKLKEKFERASVGVSFACLETEPLNKE